MTNVSVVAVPKAEVASRVVVSNSLSEPVVAGEYFAPVLVSCRCGIAAGVSAATGVAAGYTAGIAAAVAGRRRRTSWAGGAAAGRTRACTESHSR